ncbi:hypothetical protein [Exiguobacterium sp. Leaf196]|uniref:hypothetical protein n=1 Tax=Exiguobacterium sp. Leaf196 TaxID=1736298 RepID=UPI0006FDA8AA|nr:hypothetical protein [Exiguobacterium sp. Leaf196]KQS45461.1 hypothetical protein ASG02_05305 [Exiguobacterium sp. Leaf196]
MKYALLFTLPFLLAGCATEATVLPKKTVEIKKSSFSITPATSKEEAFQQQTFFFTGTLDRPLHLKAVQFDDAASPEVLIDKSIPAGTYDQTPFQLTYDLNLLNDSHAFTYSLEAKNGFPEKKTIYTLPKHVQTDSGQFNDQKQTNVSFYPLLLKRYTTGETIISRSIDTLSSPHLNVRKQEGAILIYLTKS